MTWSLSASGGGTDEEEAAFATMARELLEQAPGLSAGSFYGSNAADTFTLPAPPAPDDVPEESPGVVADEPDDATPEGP